MKHFETCFLIFEEQCIKSVNDTQQAVLERKIDIMCQEVKRESQNVKNQILDCRGNLLSKNQKISFSKGVT